MSAPASLAATIGAGFLLGWSVAWPPGPINAEIVRRGLTRGFWNAWSVALGASSGDFLWALGVASGAASLAAVPAFRPVLGIVSLVLLLVLAATYLRGAWKAWRQSAREEASTRPSRFETAHGGYLLGLGLALSSPWNIAFWLAVIGGEIQRLALRRSLVLAAAVVAGALAWSAILAGALKLGARFATPTWEIVTRLGTGLLMLAFAVRLALSLASTP